MLEEAGTALQISGLSRAIYKVSLRRRLTPKAPAKRPGPRLPYVLTIA
jgi:hypothetical protein